jgi:hypothetical protein
VTDETPSGAGEVDALKWYVYGMAGVSLVGAVAVWYLREEADKLRREVDIAQTALPELAVGKGEIQAMLAAYKRNREDEARDQPLTWFQQRWKEKGIPDPSIQLDAWKNPPETSSDGTYVEEKISIKFSNKNPLRREQVAQFLHHVEHSSTRLRILTLQVRRNGRDEALANDEWTGSCEVGYRYPNLRE